MDNRTKLRQQTLTSSVFYHVFTGVLVLCFQFITVASFINIGYPPYLSGLIGFLFVSVPVQLAIIMNEIKTIENFSILDLRARVFYWIPEWLLLPFPLESIQSNRIVTSFILTLVIDGIINPIVEELYWRGYLLKKITKLGLVAPVFNGALFGFQHFWQPFNYVLIIPYSILLSYIVLRTGDLRLSILIHCIINLLGALITFIPIL